MEYESDSPIEVVTSMERPDSRFLCNTLCQKVSSHHRSELKITIETPIWAPKLGFKNSGISRAELESDRLVVTLLDGSATFKLPVECMSHVPRLRVDMDTIHLPDSEYGIHSNTMCMLYNDSDIPLDYEIEPASPFRFDSAVGRICPLGSKTILVTFVPTRLGPFRTEVKVKYCESKYELTLYCTGRCVKGVSGGSKPVRGLLALEEDFVREKRFGSSIVVCEKRDKFKKESAFKDSSSGLVAPNMRMSELTEMEDGGVSTLNLPNCGRKIFPSVPMNDKQRQECETALSEKELKLVQQDLHAINFGTVYIGEERGECFGLLNATTKCLLIEIQEDKAMHVRVLNSTQVVPPGKEFCVFEVIPTGRIAGHHQTNLLIKINGKISKKLHVSYLSEFKRLEFSSKFFPMKFDAKNDSQETAAELTITNPCTCPVGFNWTQILSTDSVFSVEPRRGTVAASGNLQCRVAFKPSPGVSRSEAELVCEIDHSDSVKVKVTGVCPVTQCVAVPEKLDFGKLCVFDTGRKMISIQNSGQGTAVYSIEGSSDIVSVRPCRGRLPPDNSENIEVNVCVTSPGKLEDAFVQIFNRAGKPVRVNLEGEAELPRITTKSNLVDFSPKTPVGSFSTTSFLVQNHSPFFVSIKLDMDAHPEFTVVSPVHIPANESVNVDLCFRPLQVKKHEFQVPIFFSTGIEEFSKIQIRAESVPPLLTVVPASICLGRTLKVGSTKVLPLSVTMHATVDWEIDVSALPGCITASKNEESNILSVTVSPHSVCEIQSEIHIFVEGKQYLTIPISGSVTEPRVLCRETCINFPPTRPGIASAYTLELENDGFEVPVPLNASFDSPYKDSSLVTLKFRSKNTIGGSSLTESSVFLQLSLMSPKALSFVGTLVIEFNNACIRLPMRGIVDLSPLTFPAGSTDEEYVLRFFNLSSIPNVKGLMDIIERFKPGVFGAWFKRNSSKRKSVTRNFDDQNVVKFLLAHGAIFVDPILELNGKAMVEALCQVVKIFNSNHFGPILSTSADPLAIFLNKFPYLQAFNAVDTNMLRINHANPSMLRMLLDNAMKELGCSLLPENPPDGPRSDLLQNLLMRECDFQLEPLAVPIEFQTSLALSLGKQIKVKIPRAGASLDSAKLYGSCEFSLTEPLVFSDGIATVGVAFKPKFKAIRPSFGFLHLLGSSGSGFPVVLKLIGTCINADPISVIPLRVEILKQTNMDLEVKNPFNEEATFNVISESKQVVFPRTFMLRVNKNEITKLPITCIPFEIFETPKRFIIRFLDEQVGEFTIGLDVVVTPPGTPRVPLMRMVAQTGSSITKEMVVEGFNSELESARNAVSSILKSTGSLLVRNNDQTSYRLFLSNESTFDITEKQIRKSESPIRIAIVFKPKNVGLYRTILTVQSDQGVVRKFLIEGTSYCPPLQVHMRMETFAKQRICQEIPIRNYSENNSRYSISLTGTNFLRISPESWEIFVDAKSVKYLTLEFNPKWILHETNTLLIKNESTFELIEVVIESVAKDPLAESKISVNCVARETQVVSIPLPSLTFDGSTTTFSVETDLDDVFGESKITVAPNTQQVQAEYILQVKASCGRTVKGSISFHNVSSGEYFWYLIELISSPPNNAAILNLSSTVFESVILEIELVNSLETKAFFSAIIDGEYLSGKSEFFILPHSTYSYSLRFAPLSSGVAKGSIAFSSPELGEVWYILSLIANEKGPIDLGVVTCPIGQSKQIDMPIANTSDTLLKLDGRCDSNDFHLIENHLEINERNSINGYLVFTPSSVCDKTICNIVWTSEKGAAISFLILGQGLPPASIEMNIAVELNMTKIFELEFENPFTEKINVEKITSTNGNFKLLKNSSSLSVKPKTKLHIPISVTPRSMSTLSGHILLSAKGYEWKYAVRCVAELPVEKSELYSFTSRARIPSKFTQSVMLKGLFDIDANLTASLETTSKQNKRVLEQGVKIQTLETAREITPDGLKILIQLELTAFKPFSQSSLLVISDGVSRWKFQSKFHVTPPPVDDEILIETPLNVAGYVSFPLANVFDSFDSFEANIQDSSGSFTVSPTSGVLSPSSSGPVQQFTIAFKPRKYGRFSNNCTLVIQTELVYWSFLLKGSLPTYTPPRLHHL